MWVALLQDSNFLLHQRGANQPWRSVPPLQPTLCNVPLLLFKLLPSGLRPWTQQELS